MKNGQKTNKWGVNFHFGVEIKADKGEKESRISIKQLDIVNSEYSGPKWTTVRSKSTAIK